MEFTTAGELHTAHEVVVLGINLLSITPAPTQRLHYFNHHLLFELSLILRETLSSNLHITAYAGTSGVTRVARSTTTNPPLKDIHRVSKQRFSDTGTSA